MTIRETVTRVLYCDDPLCTERVTLPYVTDVYQLCAAARQRGWLVDPTQPLGDRCVLCLARRAGDL